ncbi:SepM family pheromone-processing serine protease [Cohnella luojiensis]|uniref:endopeptidase La n=1 Tax=Cohnella luojiensis TaxID=652876 RepID=A0A4Y8M2J0_9BACL|nr:SepM family pheromone-processing serine protease [Cohnella luojiensis]TFE26895.1 PDZ domain-containing protein [Cohnella luojiensis]
MASTNRLGIRRYRTALLIGFLFLLFLFAYLKPWPYMLYGPGSAESVHPRVETGHKLDEKGALLFTTVSTYSNPNIFSIIYARLNPRMEVKSQEEATGGVTNIKAYRNLLSWMRDSSEANALMAAYKVMNKPIDVKQEGVIVYALLPESKARENGLQEGDIITHADGKETKTVKELSGYLSGKKPGDKVTVSGTRGEEKFEATVPLIKMNPGNRTGIGFQNDTVLKVTPSDPVKFDFADTGGPSAGLMMTLEIVAQLTGEDLTRGFRIAGTGTISADGTVGLIGGINYKLMAADRENADYFLVPYNEKNKANWTLAEKTVKDLKLSPKLVKVSTLQEALDFLKGLAPKKT